MRPKDFLEESVAGRFCQLPAVSARSMQGVGKRFEPPAPGTYGQQKRPRKGAFFILGT
jgi:hypothetical protein